MKEPAAELQLQRQKRAAIAYLKHTPDGLPTGIETVRHDGLEYIVLTDDKQKITVYRVRNDGQLKRLRRPPSIVAAHTQRSIQ